MKRVHRRWPGLPFVLMAAYAIELQAADPTYRDLDDSILGEALILSGTQLFIDDYLIDEMTGVRREMHQPVKHAANPIIIPDQPGEEVFNRGSVLYDADERLFKMWYIVYDEEVRNQLLGYATSIDGVNWKKP